MKQEVENGNSSGEKSMKLICCSEFSKWQWRAKQACSSEWINQEAASITIRHQQTMQVGRGKTSKQQHTKQAAVNQASAMQAVAKQTAADEVLANEQSSGKWNSGKQISSKKTLQTKVQNEAAAHEAVAHEASSITSIRSSNKKSNCKQIICNSPVKSFIQQSAVNGAMSRNHHCH